MCVYIHIYLKHILPKDQVKSPINRVYGETEEPETDFWGNPTFRSLSEEKEAANKKIMKE